MKILKQGFDHVEFIVKDVDQHASIYQRMGFEKIGERKLAAKGTRSVVYAQGFVRIMLTQTEGKGGENQDCCRRGEG
jgi:4-hydroxyphenylpyruvate dioxygenase-like putative hemolysin